MEIDKLSCKNELKKPKFLWFLIDGLSFDQFAPFLEQHKHKGALFRAITTYYKQSGSLHCMIVTGKYSRNMAASRILTDNLIDNLRFRGNDEKIVFSGQPFPIGTLSGATILDRDEEQI